MIKTWGQCLENLKTTSDLEHGKDNLVASELKSVSENLKSTHDLKHGWKTRWLPIRF